MEIDYEKAYNEALERAKRLRDSKYQTMNAKRVAEEIFTVLAESEDERIRKELIAILKKSYNSGITLNNKKDLDSYLAYLEKQKPENVSATTMIPSCWEVDQKEQKPPITGNDFGWIDELKHDLEHPEELDQKVDDVLKQRNGTRALEWSEEDERKLKLCEDSFRVPQTRQHLIQQGLTPGDMVSWLKSLCPQPKQEWSEEDESRLDDIEKAISNYYDLNHAPQYHYWLEQKLKSLRHQPKQEWSENDEKILDELLDHCNTENATWYNWLKSLRPQPHWKPSKEQMDALNALNCHGDLSYVGQQKQLISLYNDLKKLM